MQLWASSFDCIVDHFEHHFWTAWDFAVHSVSNQFWHAASRLSGHSQLQESSAQQRRPSHRQPQPAMQAARSGQGHPDAASQRQAPTWRILSCALLYRAGSRYLFFSAPRGPRSPVPEAHLSGRCHMNIARVSQRFRSHQRLLLF